MQRLQTVLISILCGALAVGIGMGVFLKKANDDRTRLEQTANQAIEQSKTATSDREKAVAEANKRIEEANNQLSQNQALMKALTDERDAIASAIALSAPAPKSIRGWKDQLVMDQGISMKLPTSYTIFDSSSSTFSAGVSSSTPNLIVRTIDQPFDSLTATSTSISFVVDGHLLTGNFITSETGTTYRLIAQKNGVKTHQIQVFDAKSTLAQTILSTLKFAK